MNLLEKISQKQALIGIIGLGYVGLPLVLRFGEVGFKILGFDSDTQKVEKFSIGENPISNIFQAQGLPNCGKATQLEATADMQRLSEPDVLLICVPTPFGCQPGTGFKICRGYH